MEQPKQKVFVFDKAELFFLFLFFIVMAVTAFVLGMRLGKKQAELFLQPDTSKISSTLDIKSGLEEEQVKKLEEPVVNEEQAFQDKPTASSDMDEETFKKLQAEYEKINTQDITKSTVDASPVATDTVESGSKTEVEPQAQPAVENTATTAPETNVPISDNAFLKPDPSFVGKFTIQLGSYRTLDEAKGFADGFLVRGYKPLIKEVEVGGKTWFRVSLGVFESMNAAKTYIQREQSLFGAYKDQYFVTEIK